MVNESENSFDKALAWEANFFTRGKSIDFALLSVNPIMYRWGSPWIGTVKPSFEKDFRALFIRSIISTFPIKENGKKVNDTTIRNRTLYLSFGMAMRRPLCQPLVVKEKRDKKCFSISLFLSDNFACLYRIFLKGNI